MNMKYVALLRGINVGGNRKVPMADLKVSFEQLGFTGVKTLINSGNVIFESDINHDEKLTKMIEKQLEKDFGFAVATIVRSQDEIQKVVKAVPVAWVNNADMKCDVMFLWPEIDNKKVLDQIAHNPDMEDLKYVSGAVIWRIDRQNATKSKVIRIVGTKPYKQMTIRNCNTVRKLNQLMD
jgi:uncharacterized protein (DUF1697 family)